MDAAQVAARARAINGPPMGGASGIIQNTISEDRTQDSFYETTSLSLSALGRAPRPGTRPTVAPGPAPRPPGPPMGGTRPTGQPEHAFSGGLDPRIIQVDRKSKPPRPRPGGRSRHIPGRPVSTPIRFTESDHKSHDGPSGRHGHLSTNQLMPFRESSLLEPPKSEVGGMLEGGPTMNHTSNAMGADMVAPTKDSAVSQDESWPSDDTVRLLARHLGVPEESATSLEMLQSYVSYLQSYAIPVPNTSNQPETLTVYRVFSGKEQKERMYLDKPHWRQGARRKEKLLLGDVPIANLAAYLSQHLAVSFIIFRDYDIPTTDNSRYDQTTEHTSESIQPVMKSLADAIKMFLDRFDPGSHVKEDNPLARWVDSSSDSSDSDDNSDDLYRTTEENNELKSCTLMAPYVAIYHSRGEDMSTFMDLLNDQQRDQFQLMLDFVLSEYGSEYATVDNLIARGTITHGLIQYLFKPGDVVVAGKGMDAQGHLCRSWPQIQKRTPTSNRPRALLLPRGETSQALPASISLEIKTTHWEFGGSFISAHQTLEMKNIDSDYYSERDINSLSFHPLDHVDKDTTERLRQRGHWFWRCRGPCMISYKEDGDRKLQGAAGGRYMIDMMAYHKLHPKNVNVIRVPSVFKDLSPDMMEQREPPTNDYIYLLPPKMKGFNLTTKKWLDLQVDNFNEVVWNTGAFETLVLNGKTKRLIQALISDQIEAEKSTDLISGKGNGLIMLLHGGPGTGKTLTAESVAEIAKKPLYPVTCGDIGTQPRAVEEYLESVLYLGKIWGCVVLLDEADVFLEQRSLEDLHRNALVSVFLRVLEYYDGILVLTSNRVGIFDEAFKSRIQLAIHYTSLTVHQRTKIWGNFLVRLKTLNEEGIDFEDLEDHIEELAQHKMNGREIRNVITTARQFARWERKQHNGGAFLLNYKVMDEIIETSGKFDRYIEKLNGGMTQDQLAEDEGLRLASGT
ncbi:hypothetical protein PG993_013418 [Apiospora rasikravindrae]|uniref:AAA+ ATPase domain-containing protein n=1 Tax=Apiospora rasikravindrae TaxID=990691 RepID=A0ABR1RXL2_9PEZI